MNFSMLFSFSFYFKGIVTQRERGREDERKRTTAGLVQNGYNGQAEVRGSDLLGLPPEWQGSKQWSLNLLHFREQRC